MTSIRPTLIPVCFTHLVVTYVVRVCVHARASPPLEAATIGVCVCVFALSHITQHLFVLAYQRRLHQCSVALAAFSVVWLRVYHHAGIAQSHPPAPLGLAPPTCLPASSSMLYLVRSTHEAATAVYVGLGILKQR